MPPVFVPAAMVWIFACIDVCAALAGQVLPIPWWAKATSVSIALLDVALAFLLGPNYVALHAVTVWFCFSAVVGFLGAINFRM
jgi:hypothetical protein